MTIEEFAQLPPESQRKILFDAQYRGAIKVIIRTTLDEIESWRRGIHPSSRVKARDMKEGRLYVGAMFREPPPYDREQAATAKRSMTVGSQELVMEFSPGMRPPTYLKMRPVRGGQLSDEVLKFIGDEFLRVKDQGIFEQSYLLALQQLIRDFVNHFPIINHTKTN